MFTFKFSQYSGLTTTDVEAVLYVYTKKLLLRSVDLLKLSVIDLGATV